MTIINIGYFYLVNFVILLLKFSSTRLVIYFTFIIIFNFLRILLISEHSFFFQIQKLRLEILSIFKISSFLLREFKINISFSPLFLTQHEPKLCMCVGLYFCEAEWQH